MKATLHKIARGVIAALPLVLAGPAQADEWPSKPLRLVVPNAAGGGLDAMGRLLASKMTESLGQPVIVDNKPGASTIIGTDAVAKSAPDGYTFGLVTDSHTINPSFVPKLPFDPVKDFAPITKVVDGYYVLVVNPKLHMKTARDFVAAAKAQPGKMSYGSAGSGSPHHLTMEWLKSMAGIDIIHVPYKGVAPAVGDAIAGHVDAVFSGPPTALPHAASGRLTALAITSPKRLAYAPGLPTMAESGYPEFVASFWYGLLAPAGTPHEIVLRLNADVRKVLAQPDVKEKLKTLGLEAAPMTPEEFAAFMKKDAANYAQIIKTSGAKPD